MTYLQEFGAELPTEILDILPNPILVKDKETRYVWVNRAFETLFNVDRNDLIGRFDLEIFPDRQVAQCNGGDLRVLSTGEIDEAYETVFRGSGEARETITRKSRLMLSDGTQLLVGVMHDITEMTNANRQLEEAGKALAQKADTLKKLADTDTLTGCLNRRALFEKALQLNETTDIGVLLLDLDHFKSVNDTHGHEAGDSVLVRFAQTVRQLLPSNALFARLGGEEFAVLLEEATPNSLRETAECLRRDWSALELHWKDSTIQSTVSIGGIIASSKPDLNLDRVLASADANLYKAKKHGRNKVVFGH